MQRLFGNDVHLAVQQILQILDQSYVIEQAAVRIHFHEEIDIALRPGLTSGNRPEDANVMGAVLGCDPVYIYFFLT